MCCARHWWHRRSFTIRNAAPRMGGFRRRAVRGILLRAMRRQAARCAVKSQRSKGGNVRTIRATAPLRWAPFLTTGDTSCFRKALNGHGGGLRPQAIRDREDAVRFKTWIGAGHALYVQKKRAYWEWGDHFLYARCRNTQEPLGEYIFQMAIRAKIYKPAFLGVVE